MYEEKNVILGKKSISNLKRGLKDLDISLKISQRTFLSKTRAKQLFNMPQRVRVYKFKS